jgi:hypothetical protein
MRTFTTLLAAILLSGCVKDNWNASLEEQELSYEVTERLRIDLDDGEVIWECPIMTGEWFCQTP